tara:strand:- start:59 stop:382 length:324 start_codon:yes stop_codon:yes gene_type:complete
VICITTSSDSKEVLVKISKFLIENKLSACNKITTTHSSFMWEDKYNLSKEYKLEIKTTESLENSVIDCIDRNHNYKIYELSKYKFEIINPKYQEWFYDRLNNIEKEK